MTPLSCPSCGSTDIQINYIDTGGYQITQVPGTYECLNPDCPSKHPCPRCGDPMHKVPVPTEPGDTSWVWGHDCLPD